VHAVCPIASLLMRCVIIKHVKFLQALISSTLSSTGTQCCDLPPTFSRRPSCGLRSSFEVALSRERRAPVTWKLCRPLHTRSLSGTLTTHNYPGTECKCRNQSNRRLSQDLRVAIKCSEAAFSDFIAATETRALEYIGWVVSCKRSILEPLNPSNCIHHNSFVLQVRQAIHHDEELLAGRLHAGRVPVRLQVPYDLACGRQHGSAMELTPSAAESMAKLSTHMKP
jgi:hypothetical protein